MVPGRLLRIRTTQQKPVGEVVFGVKEGIAEGEACAPAVGPRRRGPRGLLPDAQVWLDGWTGCTVLW